MKKIVKTILIVLLILIVFSGALAVCQWNNIKALVMSVNYSAEEIEALSKKNEEKITTVLEELNETKITENEVEEDSSEKAKLKIDAVVAEIYKLRSEYVSALSNLEAEAKAMAKSIPKKQRTATKKLEMIEIYTGKAVALEKQCDAKMETLIAKIKAELKGRKESHSLVSEIRSLYESEKKIKKSQLLNKYKKYLQ